jgi:hypothetical protein
MMSFLMLINFGLFALAKQFTRTYTSPGVLLFSNAEIMGKLTEERSAASLCGFRRLYVWGSRKYLSIGRTKPDVQGL